MKLGRVVKVEHPDAIAALVASVLLDKKHPDEITKYLIENRVNRKLYVLAATLRAADNSPTKRGALINETA